MNCRSLAALGMTVLCAVVANAQKPANTISGVVRGPERMPLADVEVSLRPSGKRTRSDSLGQYRFENVRPGHYVALARKAGWRPEQWDVAVQRGVGANADFDLAIKDEHPVEPDSNRKCPGLSLKGFECRRSVASGLFYDFPDIDTERETVPELFRDIPGFRVRPMGGGPHAGYIVEPTSGSSCIRYLVDGKLATQANPIPPVTRDILAMEIYKRADSVPVVDMREVLRANSLGNCRVVLFWTSWAKS
jgi:hypothetical protein